jgi:two-component system OmpR family sensor kinase/two-component system sensor histidine kinase QseC
LSLNGKEAIAHWHTDRYGAPAADSVAEILDAGGNVLFRTDPDVDLPTALNDGFNNVAVDGLRWRIYRLAGTKRVVQVGQPWQIRRKLALRATLRSLAPLLALVPLMGFFISWLIRRELRAVRRLEREVAGLHARTLRPVSEARLPSELAPVAQAINQLLERLDQVLCAQRNFIGDAAHELRSPATALQLQLEILDQELAGRFESDALRQLRDGVRRITRLTSQLLTAATTDPTEEALNRAPLEFAELLRREVAGCFMQAQAKGMELTVDAPEQLSIEGDAERLRILLRNVLDNAIRYTPAEGRVALSLVRREDRALLAVDDSGPGIPVDERERVFQRFYRGRSVTKAGNGLGLSIVRNIALLHGAQIGLATSALGGLRVEIALPIRPD